MIEKSFKCLDIMTEIHGSDFEVYLGLRLDEINTLWPDEPDGTRLRILQGKAQMLRELILDIGKAEEEKESRLRPKKLRDGALRF